MEVLGSDAESEDGDIVSKAIDVAEAKWQEKWATRKQKKLSECVLASREEKIKHLDSIMVG